jgi:hypothetical protein
MSEHRMVRKLNLKLYSQLYSELPVERLQDRYRCFYCGQEAGTIDHQPPLSVIGSLITSGMSFDCVKVPCCHSCNSHLGALPTITLSERFEALKDRLRQKYRKELRLQGQWTVDEVFELGHSLRSMVLGAVAIGLDAEERLLYPGHRLRNIESMTTDGNMSECRVCGLIFDDANDSCPVCSGLIQDQND